MTLKTTRDKAPFRIKSPQLYQLSYRPKNRETLWFPKVDLLDDVGIVPRVYPGRYADTSSTRRGRT
jgi:hypothetical protein